MTIRLAPVLPTNVAVVQFPDVHKATEAVIEIVNSGVGIRTLSLSLDVCLYSAHLAATQNASSW